MSDRGACPECGRVMLLTSAGRIRHHGGPVGRGCVGVGELPAPTEQELQAAEEARQGPFERFVESRGGFGGSIYSGVYSHGHYAHGNATFDAASGRLLGVFSVVLSDDMPPPPDVCPVCRDFGDWASGGPAVQEETGPQ